MTAFPVWPLIAAAWGEVWHEKPALIKAGWPVFIVVLASILAQMAWSFPAPPRLSPVEILGGTSGSHNFLVQLLTTPALICANSLAFGAWSRLVAGGEIRWGVGGRAFLPVLLVRLKALIAFVIVFAAGLWAYRGFSGWGEREPALRFASLAIMPICVIALDLLTVKFSLLVPYAALTEHFDLRGGIAPTRGHGWLLFLLLLCSATTILALLVTGTLMLTLIVAVLGSILIHAHLQPGLAKFVIGVASAVGIFSVYFPCLMFAVGVVTRAYLALAPKPERNPWQA